MCAALAYVFFALSVHLFAVIIHWQDVHLFQVELRIHERKSPLMIHLTRTSQTQMHPLKL